MPTIKPGPVATRAANEAIAQSLAGVREITANRNRNSIDIWNRFSRVALGSPYCQSFANYRVFDAAADLGVTVPKWLRDVSVSAHVPLSAYTPTVASAFKAQGLWTDASKGSPFTVAPGDWVYFYKPLIRRIGHVEIVVEVDANGFETVGANTAPNRAGMNDPERDGDGVYRKRYSWGRLKRGSGFGRIPV